MNDHREIYQTLFERLRDPVILLDASGKVIEMNRAATTLLSDITGQDTTPMLSNWFGGDRGPGLEAAPPHAVQLLTLDTPAGIRQFELESQLASDQSDRFRGTIIILHEVTELKDAERDALNRSASAQLISGISAKLIGIEPHEFDEAVDESLGRIGTYNSAAGAFIVQFDTMGDRVYLSHWWSSRDESPPGARFDAVEALQVQAWRATLAQSDLCVLPLQPGAAGGDRVEPLLDCLGVPCVVRLPLLYHNEPIGCMGLTSADPQRTWPPENLELLKKAAQVLTNALQQRRVEEALAQERNLLRTLIDSLPDYIYIKDVGSRFVMNNAAHLRLLRAKRQDEVYGKTDHDIFPPDLADSYLRDERGVMESGQPLVNRDESVLTEAGERRWVLTTKVPLKNAEGESVGVVGVGRDITARKQMAEQLESHARLLEQANADLSARNQELDEFTYVASHDLQEPLRKLISFSDVLREDLDAGDMQGVTRAANTISSAARRMKTLVEDLLALSRSGRQSMHWQEVDLGECLAMALDVLEVRIAEEKAEIEVQPLPTVYGDRNLLAQLFQNLIGNALKFHGDAPPWITFTVEPDGDDWIVGIRDNGIGINPEYAEQIFAPFKRLHGRGQYEGTGIGLAICRKIVERHEGRIWVEPAHGGGSHFRFVLRARQEEPST